MKPISPAGTGWLRWLFALLVVGLAGCIPSSITSLSNLTRHFIEIPFATIEQRSQPLADKAGYLSTTISMVVLTTRSEVDAIRDWISDEALLECQRLNLEDGFCLAVFLGKKPSSGYQVIVDRITRSDDDLLLHVSTIEPAPDRQAGTPGTSPYHLIKLKKGADLRGLHSFKLIVNRQEIALLEKILP